MLYHLAVEMLKLPEHECGYGGGRDQHIRNWDSVRKSRLYSNFAKNAVGLSIQMC